MPDIRSKLITVAAVGAAVVGGGAIANAATSSTASRSPSSSGAPPGQPTRNAAHGRHTVNGRTEAPLSGDVAAKVRAAALAKVSGTVERVETNVDSAAPYEAHIVRSDGTHVEVQVNRDFSVAAVNTMGSRHP